MASIAGTNLAAPVVPFTTDDFYPTHKAQYGQGGWQEVATIADRDAITSARREAGMAVFVTAENTLYVLNADLTTWTEFKSKSSDGIRRISDFTNCDPLFDGEIVEYTGTTDQTYTNGYFYKGVAQGTDPETYTWERIDVQPSLVDNTTIVKDANQVITTIGVKTKSNDIMYDWVGTLAQWQAGRQAGTIPDSWICWITDDEDEPAGIANLAQVASSGSYNDLTNKPALVLPALPSDSTNYDYTLKWNHTTQQLEWVRAA